MSTGGLFSFNPAAGETPETLKRRRQVAEAMLANAVGQPASTIGGGLADLGQAIGGRLALGRVNRAEAAGQAGAASAFSKLFGGGAAAPGETAALPGTEPVSGTPPTAGSVALAGANTGIPDVARMEAEIRRVAPKYGIDPDIAVKVARSEGLAPGVWQSNVTGSGGRETSYGPFQLLAGGGLGDEFQRTTGLDLRDPKTWQAQIDFALGQAAKQGWTPWHGAAKVGVGPRTGIGGGTPAVTAALAGTEPVASADPAALAAAGMGGGNFDFSRYATGGAAARPDSFSGLKPAMASGLEAMISSAPPDIQRELRVTSGYRSPETQKVLFDRAVKKYGSVSAARHNVAPPGRSQHGFGNAIDWKFASKRAREWVHANAGKYGFTFPLGHEPWHMEVAGARGPSGGPAVSQNASGRGRPIDSTSGSIFALAGGGGQPAATRAQMSGGLPAVMEALTGAAPQQQAISGTGAGPDVRAMLAGGGYIDPAAKDDMLSENIPDTAFRPAGGPTPYSAGATVLGGNSANAGRLVPVPDPNRPPAVAPVAPVAPVASVAAPEAPPVAATAPAAPGVAPVAQALGYDPLPQTSAMPGVGGVQGAGHESLSPGAQAVSQALAGGGGTDTLAGGGGKGFFGRLFGGRTGTPPAVAGGGGAVPPPAATGAPGVGGSAGPEGAPGAGGGFSPRAQAAIAALQNPWLNEGQQAVAKTVLDQEIEQADPKYQADLAKVRYDLAVSQAKSPIDIAKAQHDLDVALARDPIDLEKARVELEQAKTPTRAMTDAEKRDAGIDPSINARIDAKGNVTEGPKIEPKIINNTAYHPVTGEPLWKADPGTKLLTSDEAKAMKLPLGAGNWMVDADGKPSIIPGTEPSDPEYNDYVRETLAAGAKPVDRLEWKRSSATTVNIGENGVKYPDPGKDKDYYRNEKGEVILFPIEGGPPGAKGPRQYTLPGTETAAAEAAAETGVTTSAETKGEQADVVIDTIGRLREDVKKQTWYDPITGFTGARAANIEGTAAYNARQLAKTLDASMAFDRLEQMRTQESPTGGALGAITERELDLLKSSIASLDLGQGKEQFFENLAIVEDRYKRIMEKAKDYTNADKYGFGNKKTPAPETPTVDNSDDPLDLFKILKIPVK